MAHAYYGIACMHAHSKNKGLTLSFLKQALSKGFSNMDYIEKDSDWKGLRTNPEFIRLLATYRHTEMPSAGEEKRGKKEYNAKELQSFYKPQTFDMDMFKPEG